MRIKLLSFLLLTCFLITSCSNPIIKGNGEIITQEINIQDYDALEVEGGRIILNYSQKTSDSYFSITTDENILEKYYIRVEGKTLKVKPKEEYRRANFQPTQFNILTHSTELTRMGIAGNGEANINETLHTDNLKIEIAGSGTVNLNDSVFMTEVKTNIAGSANLNAPALIGTTFRGEIAGSGKLYLGGMVENSSYNVAGSGKVFAFDLETANTKCEIAGSGNMEVTVSNSLNVNIAGSGSIRYKGEPEISKSIAGSGSIKQVE